MSRLPIPRFIQEIKTKLGFDRAMTAPGNDVIDAVNKLSDKTATEQGVITSSTGEIIASSCLRFGKFAKASFIYKHGSGSQITIQMPFTFVESTYYIVSSVLRESSITIASTANTENIGLVSGNPTADTNYIIDIVYITT